MRELRPLRPGLSFCLALSLVVGLAACGDDDESSTGPTPTTGGISVSVLDVGGTASTDDLSLLIDGVANPITAGQSIQLDGLQPGDVTLELTGLDSACRLLGASSRTLTVVPGRTARAFFEVVCGDIPELGRISSYFRGSAGQSDPPSGTVLTMEFGSPNVFDGVSIPQTQVGVDFVTDSSSDPDFDALVALLTNGTSDAIPFAVSLSGFGGGSGARNDFSLPGYASSADFVGATITSMVARMDNYDVVSFGPGAGYSYDIGYSATIYGYPPTTAQVLGSVEGYISGETPIAPPDSVAVVFEFGVGSEADTGRVFANVFDSLDFSEAEEGQRFFVGLNDDADFAALAEALGNGVEDCLAFRVRLAGTGVQTSGCVPESDIDQAGVGPDFSGATVTGCRITIDDLYIGDNFTRAPAGTAAMLEYDLRYTIEFVGFPAPATAGR